MVLQSNRPEVASMLLYDSRVSGNCYKVRLLLAQLGIPSDRQEVDVVHRRNRAALLGALNPALRVPTLVLDDGRPLAESNAILWYFADGTHLLPDDRFDRAKVLQWMCFEQYSHEPNIADFLWRVRKRLPDAGLIGVFDRSHYEDVLIARVRRLASPAELDARRTAGYLALDAMEGHLATAEFFVADRYTIADIALYAYTHVAEEAGFDLSGYPAITAWLARVASQAGHLPITA